MDEKILIIDDQDFDQKIMNKCLTDFGFKNITFANSGEKGIEAVKNDQPDVVVIDTNLPGMDGFETCKQVKAIDASIKVVVMTGNPHAVNFLKAKSLPVDEYTVKTPNCGEIIWSIRRCLKTKDS